MSQKEYIPALGHDWLTGFYDLTIKLTMPEQKFKNQLIDELGPKPNEKILEFGFGTGTNLLVAVERSLESDFTGLDIYSPVREIAARKF